MDFKLFWFVVLLLTHLWCVVSAVNSSLPNQFIEGVFVGDTGQETSYRRERWFNEHLYGENVLSGAVSPDCTRYLEQFSNATAKFINCTVANARPLHYCENCVGEYMSVKNVYKMIFNKEGSNGTNNCKQEILRADNVQVVGSTYNFILGIWDKSKCDQCFDVSTENNTEVYRPRESSKKLLKMIQDTLHCFSDFSHGVVPGFDQNQTVCSMCKELYCDANDYYEVVEGQNRLCSDLIDSMNYTRLDWGRKFKCSVAQKDQGEIWEIAALVFALPILLYVGVWVHANQELVLANCGIVRHRRLSNSE